MNSAFRSAFPSRLTLPEAEAKPMLLLRQTVMALKPAFEQYLGISQARFILILFLHTEGEISQTQIQKGLGVDRAMITRLVKQMEAGGLVVRRIDPLDNRFTLVRLSETGVTLYNYLIKRIQELENLLLRGIDEDEFLCFQRSLEFIRNNAENITTNNNVHTRSSTQDLFE